MQRLIISGNISKNQYEFLAFVSQFNFGMDVLRQWCFIENRLANSMWTITSIKLSLLSNSTGMAVKFTPVAPFTNTV